jgi:hypothetical protein
MRLRFRLNVSVYGLLNAPLQVLPSVSIDVYFPVAKKGGTQVSS